MLRIDKNVLARALGIFTAGPPDRFDDRLWIAFGDAWTLVRRALEHHQLIRAPRDADPVLTSHGRALLDAIPPSPSPPSSPTRDPDPRATHTGTRAPTAPLPRRADIPA